MELCELKTDLQCNCRRCDSKPQNPLYFPFKSASPSQSSKTIIQAFKEDQNLKISADPSEKTYSESAKLQVSEIKRFSNILRPSFFNDRQTKDQKWECPVPGFYTLDLTTKREGNRIGKSLRSDFIDINNSTPGPVRYNNLIGSQLLVGPFKRLMNLHILVTPGSGKYKGKSLSKCIHPSINIEKRKKIYLNETPWSGAYDLWTLTHLGILLERKKELMKE